VEEERGTYGEVGPRGSNRGTLHRGGVGDFDEGRRRAGDGMRGNTGARLKDAAGRCGRGLTRAWRLPSAQVERPQPRGRRPRATCRRDWNVWPAATACAHNGRGGGRASPPVAGVGGARRGGRPPPPPSPTPARPPKEPDDGACLRVRCDAHPGGPRPGSPTPSILHGRRRVAKTPLWGPNGTPGQAVEGHPSAARGSGLVDGAASGGVRVRYVHLGCPARCISAIAPPEFEQINE